MSTLESPPDDVREQLAAITARLDVLIERQEQIDDLIAEMTPIVRDMVRVGGEKLAAFERAGHFERLGELFAVAEEAADVLHESDAIKPVGMVGMVRATGDGEVQHGMAIALEILRHLGRARIHATSVPGPAAVAEPPTSTHPPTPRAVPADERVEWEGHTFDGQGFLVDPATWNEELCGKMAGALGVTLTDEHWAVIRWVRSDYLTHGASPNVRRTAAGSGAGTHRLYELFPKTPGKTAALLAGVPKPVGCV